MEDRLKALEHSHGQVKIIVDNLVRSNTNIEVSIATLSSEFKAMHDDAEQHEKTLRNLDESIKNLTNILNTSRLENYKDVNSALTPVYERIRSIETTFVDKTVSRVRTEAAAIFVISSMLMGAIYAYMMNEISETKKQINKEHSIVLKELSKSKRVK